MMKSGLIMAATLSMGLAGAANAQEALRLGTSESGSVFYTLAVGLSRLANEHGGVNMSVEPVGGSHANIFGLMNDSVDLAIVNAQAAHDGREGLAPFPASVDICLVANGNVSVRQLLVRRAANIDSIDDLRGKTWITNQTSNPDLGQISMAIAGLAGLTQSDFRNVEMAETAEAISGFETGTIDAATIAASAGAPTVAQLMSNRVIDYLYLTDEQMAEIVPNLPSELFPYVLRAGTYENQEKAANVFGVRTILVAQCDAPEEQVYATVASLLDNTEQYATFHPTGRQWTRAALNEKPALPFHEGTIRYLKEQGMWTEELAQYHEAF